MANHAARSPQDNRSEAIGPQLPLVAEIATTCFDYN